MNKETVEILIEELPLLIEEMGINDLIKAEVLPVRDDPGRANLKLVGPSQTTYVNSQNGLDQILQGNLKVLLKRLALVAELRGNFDALGLIQRPKFFQACLSEVNVPDKPQPNVFLQQMVNIPNGTIPIIYGSSCGINFGEICETIACSKAFESQGIQSQIVFDYEASYSSEARRIIASSRELLPKRLREQVLNYYENFNLPNPIFKQVEAAQMLLDRTPLSVKLDIVSDTDLFNNLVGPYRYTLGQIMLIAAIVGNSPQLFKDSKGPIRPEDILSKKPPLRFRDQSPAELFTKPVAEFIQGRTRPTGITYYGYYARMGQFDGVMASPIHLTDKANIYKVLEPLQSLYDPDRERGTILLPISRNWIQSYTMRWGGEPMDAVSLLLLANDQPEAFQKLMGDFFDRAQIYSPAQAISQGLQINRYFIENYFNLGDDNEE